MANRFCMATILLCAVASQPDAVQAQQGRLSVGQSLPDINMPSLTSKGNIALEAVEGQLVFTDAAGKMERPRAAIVFFVRY